MPVRDAFYQAFCKAIEKEDWVITDDPFFIEICPGCNVH